MARIIWIAYLPLDCDCSSFKSSASLRIDEDGCSDIELIGRLDAASQRWRVRNYLVQPGYIRAALLIVQTASAKASANQHKKLHTHGEAPAVEEGERESHV